MITITLEEIQRNLKSYLHRVKEGEICIVLDAGKPVAEIKPLAHKETELRPYGLCTGEFGVPKDFDAPLPEEIIMEFENG